MLPNWSPYVVHALFWLPYIVRGQLDRMKGRQDGTPVQADARAGKLVFQHSLATGGMYFGIGMGVFSTPTEVRGGVNELVGGGLIAAGTALSLWTLWVFRSWKIRAELSADHQLCTDGPFRLVRHPIYTAMTLLALGTAIWVPNGLTWGSLIGIAWIGDQRARAEEAILSVMFGERYRAFMAGTKRFLPWVY